MYCKKCGKQVEDVSIFCKYCGENIVSDNNEMFDADVVACGLIQEDNSNLNNNTQIDSITDENYQVLESVSIPKNVENKTENRLFGSKKAIFVIAILSLIIIALSIFLSFEISKTKELYNKISALENEVKNKNFEIYSLDSKVTKLNNDIKNNKEILIEFASKALFIDTYIALVNENSYKYHTFDCDDFDTSSFWAYNINAAEQKGYYACPKCH
jgi:cell division protein FtsL